jgi:hypothetical protein
MKVRAQIAMVLNLDKCIGCHTCSVTCKNVWTSRDGMEYAWFNNVETKPGIGYPKNWEESGPVERRLESRQRRQDRAEAGRQAGGFWPTSSPIPICPPSTTTTSRGITTTRICKTRRSRKRCPPPGPVPRSAASGCRKSTGGRTGKKSSAPNSPSAPKITTSRTCRRRFTANLKTPS